MNKFHSIALGSVVALGLIGAAHAADTAAVTGAWKLTVGAADAACTLTLADSGDVTNAGDCTNGGAAVGHWKAVGSRLQLLSNNNELVAYLQPKGDNYEGKRVADGRTVALAR
ncbi:MAG TPA: AprI/Inh family metalloprotease inhibitor [Rhizomicrobium sp.]|jgi:opacity protein-like surface antigen